MKILIGTPTGDGMVCIQYLLSVRSLEAAFKTRLPPINSNVLFGTASFMPFSRNALASIVMNDKSYTHLLFVDSDMGFQPSAVMKMIASDKDVVGCLYPKRSMQDTAFAAALASGNSLEKARSISYDYAAAEQLQKKVVEASLGKGAIHAVQDGLVKTLRLGMGLTLIKRSVFERMAQIIPDLVVQAEYAAHYLSMGLKGDVLQCFSSLTLNKVSLSEDLSFSLRWTRECDGEMWACVDQRISHVGEHVYTGRMLDQIEQQDRQALTQIGYIQHGDQG